MSSKMIDVTEAAIQDEIKVEEHGLNLNIKQEVSDESSLEVKVEEHGLNLNIKQEASGSEIKVEEQGVHLTVKCEEYSMSTLANCTTTFLESELHRESTCGLKEEVNEADSDSEVEVAKTNKGPLKRDKSLRSIQRHAFSHDDVRLMNCPHCSYKGRQKTLLLLHFKRRHPDKLPHACDLCSYRSLDLSCLEKHRKMHKREPMKCEFCNNFVTTDLIQMRSHKLQVHGHNCPHCEYKSLDADKLKRHMLMHETKKILSCENCRYKTELQFNLNRHIKRKHTAENADYKMYNCPDCPFKTNYCSAYKSHCYRHTGERPFSCYQCDYKALQKYHLEKHILYKHSNEKPFKCEVCQKGYAIQSDLQVHLAVHSKKKPFCCDECNFSTIYKSNLKNHKRIKQCKTLVCKICSYKAECVSDINRHANEHNLDGLIGDGTDFKTYNCPDCSFITNHPIIYKSHCYWHTAERSFPCNQCDYKAFQKHNLKTHILYKHSNKRPFKCEVCQKGYVRKIDLRVHLSVHLKKKPFCCDECPFSSIYKFCLKNHKRIKHSTMLEC